MTDNMVDSISVVTLTWNRDPKRLRDLVWTLVNQTVKPNEIVIVDGNVNEKKQADTLETILPFTNYHGVDINVILAHMDRFNMSKGFNIGIKRTSPDSKYVLTTGVDMLFGPNAIETVLIKLSRARIDGNAFCVSHCGFLVKGAKLLPDIFSQWDDLRNHTNPKLPTKISTGAMIAGPRKWWFDHRGYDEIHHAFGYADSDVTMRMKMSGLEKAAMFWEEAQVLHVWHDWAITRKQVVEVGGEKPNAAWGVVRNPDTWGEYE